MAIRLENKATDGSLIIYTKNGTEGEIPNIPPDSELSSTFPKFVQILGVIL